MNSPKTLELRRHPRDPMGRRAELHHDGMWVPCLIQDMSCRGFGLMCTRTLPVGHVVELRCEPYPGKVFQCKVEIRHACESFFGLLITQIDEAGRSLCTQLMADYHSDRTALNR